MALVFSASGQSEISSVCEVRISAFLATRKAPPIGNLQASVFCTARFGRFRSAGEVRSLAASSSALPVVGSSSFAHRLEKRVFIARQSGSSGGRSVGVFGNEPPIEYRPFSFLGFFKGVGRWQPSLSVQSLQSTLRFNVEVQQVSGPMIDLHGGFEFVSFSGPCV